MTEDTHNTNTHTNAPKEAPAKGGLEKEALETAENAGGVPVRIPFPCMRWRLKRGQHPHHRIPQQYYALTAQKVHEQTEVLKEFKTGLSFAATGHNTMLDEGYNTLVGDEGGFALSPLFVKDLCGRTVYIGYGPDRKLDSDFTADGRVTFPKFCRSLSHAESEKIGLERRFMGLLRPMLMSEGFDAFASGDGETPQAGYYKDANLYPYKVRLDTFYGDGWRLPQTQLVYARWDGIEAAAAQEAGKDFLHKWTARPTGQRYDAFYDGLGGADYMERLFVAGCTVIPTFEACNGYNVVAADFSLKDYWPGRAVEGLHDIVETRPDSAPEGTILDVVQPGYVTAVSVHHAQVIVSDGSGYKTPHADALAPKIPDLRLPHAYFLGGWEDGWIPTHPAHFEKPALWGWGRNGRFGQLFGPVWDPLHYYYEGVDSILEGIVSARNGTVLLVSDDVKARFKPAVRLHGYEALTAAGRRFGLPFSWVSEERVVAGVGYHPLPVQFEYALDNWCLPELMLLAREMAEVPQGLEAHLLPAIDVHLTPAVYLQHVTPPDGEVSWWHNPETMRASSGADKVDYPYLKRYDFKGDGAPDEKLSDEELVNLSPVFLAYEEQENLDRSVQDFWGNVDAYNKLSQVYPGFYEAVYEMFEQALKYRLIRHRLFQKHWGLYVVGWWRGLLPMVLEEEMFRQENVIEDDKEYQAAVPRASMVSPTV